MGQLIERSSSGDSSASLAKLPRLKRCPSCSNRLPLHSFYTAGRSKSGQIRLHSHCKRCKLQRETERRAARTVQLDPSSSLSSSLSTSLPSQLPPSVGHRNRVPEHESGVKLCTSCHRNKSLDRFYTAGRHKGGGLRYHSHCKTCKLANEAAHRMQPRKGSQEVEMSEATAGLPAHLRPEQQPGPPATTLFQQLQASRVPQPQQPFVPAVGPMPGLLNPQQLQGLLMLRQHPAMFSNPVLQGQLAMLMWSQMQQQQPPMWPLHQPNPMLQPAGGRQPSSAAAQSASTHQPSCPGPVPQDAPTPPSQECNSSGGSNDSGCIQGASGSTPKATESPSADPRLSFATGHRFADDSDSAVTWADRAGRGAEQTACTQSNGHPEASGTQFCLYNSGQLSGRDATSSHLTETAAQWRGSESPATATAAPLLPKPAQSPFTAVQQRPSAALSPYATAHRRPSGTLRASSHHTTADAIQLARAASNAAKQSLAATAAITDSALPRKGSSSLMADLRQAERQWNEAKQASTLGDSSLQGPPPQPQGALPHPFGHSQPAPAVPEIKRSSRQAARAADQAHLASEAEQSAQQIYASQQDALPSLVHANLPQLHWAGKRKRIVDSSNSSSRSNKRRSGRPVQDGFLGWTAAGGVLKPIAPRQQQHPAAAMAAPRASPSLPRAVQASAAAMAAPRAVPSMPRAVQLEPQAAQPHAAAVKKESKAVVRPEVPIAEPIELLVAAAAKAPEEVAPAFVPRHSRKKGKVQRSAFE